MKLVFDDKTKQYRLSVSCDNMSKSAKSLVPMLATSALAGGAGFYGGAKSYDNYIQKQLAAEAERKKPINILKDLKDKSLQPSVTPLAAIAGASLLAYLMNRHGRKSREKEIMKGEF